MNLRVIDWIWNIRGSLALPAGQSSDEAFARLDPLFQTRGTSYSRSGDSLTFTKENQAPQDKMAVFDGGALLFQRAAAGAVLQYRLTSRSLLFCFLAPLLFLGFAQLTILSGQFQEPEKEAAAKEKDKEKEDKVRTLHPIDQALGAPAPEKPKKDKKSGEDDKPSPTAAYVFAALFAVLYVVGRILEDRLAKRLFEKRLHGEVEPAPQLGTATPNASLT